MKHRPHLKPGLLHASEAGLDDPRTLVAERDILGGQRVIVADHHELVVELLRRLDLGRIQLRPTAPVSAEIAAGGDQGAGRFRASFIATVPTAQASPANWQKAPKRYVPIGISGAI